MRQYPELNECGFCMKGKIFAADKNSSLAGTLALKAELVEGGSLFTIYGDGDT